MNVLRLEREKAFVLTRVLRAGVEPPWVCCFICWFWFGLGFCLFFFFKLEFVSFLTPSVQIAWDGGFTLKQRSVMPKKEPRSDGDPYAGLPVLAASSRLGVN